MTKELEKVPDVLADEVRRMLAAELSMPSRLRYTGLLLVSLASAVVTGSLLATESGLPLRTTVAFVVMTAIGLSWSAFATWVLARRRVLLGQQKIVATRMAIGFAAVFAFGALALTAVYDTGRPGFAATATGSAMLVLAVILHVRARRHVERLSRRRAELERQLAPRGGIAR